MHLILLPLFAGLASPAPSGQDSLANHPDLRLALAQSQRVIKSDRDEFSGEQPGRFAFRANSVGRVTVADVSVRTVAFGNGDSSVLAAKPTATLGKDKTGFSKLSFDRPGFSEWYVNEAAGLHHWFRIDEKQGTGNLWVKLATTGAKPKQTGPDRIEFNGAKDNLSYSGLKVWDATGKKLASTMQLRGQEIVIGVEDQDAVYPVTIDPTWTEEAILTPAENPNIQRLYAGDSVSISGDTAVIGAYYSSANGFEGAGCAYVFTRRGSSWTQQATLVASDPEQYAFFGHSVSIDRDVIAIGSPLSTANGQGYAGKVYVFSKSGSTWTQSASFTGADVQNGFGFGISVKLAGRSLFVGAPNAPVEGISYAGRVYEFAATEAGWTEQTQFVSPNLQNSGSFGRSIDASGNSLIVGALEEGVDREGNAYVFTRSESGWVSETLVPSVSPLWFGFGHFVTISGDTACVTARNGFEGYDGKVLIFRREGGAWIEKAILSSPEPQNYSYFGESVAISNNSIIIGQPYYHDRDTPYYGRGGVHTFEPDGSGWSYSSTLLPSDLSIYGSGYIQFGRALSASGDSFIVGANVKDSKKGGAYVYRMEAAPVQANVSFPTSGLAGGKPITGTVTLASAQSADRTVGLESDNAALSVPATVTVPAGATTATFVAQSSQVGTDANVTVSTTGTGVISGSTSLTIRSVRVGSITIAQDQFSEHGSSSVTVALQSIAPPGGLLVALTNSNPSAIYCPATVLVPEGQSKVSFFIFGSAVNVATTVSIEATPSFGGKVDTIQVLPRGTYLASVKVYDFLVGGSNQSIVGLTRPAPAGGVTVNLASSSPDLIVPSSVFIPEGSGSIAFQIRSNKVVRDATVTATALGTTVRNTVSSVFIGISSMTVSNATVNVGQSTTVTVNLNAITPQPVTIVLTQQSNGIVSMPTEIVIPAGSSTGTFTVSGVARGATNVYGRILSQGLKGLKITVLNP